MSQKKEIVDLGFVPHKHQYDFFTKWKRRNLLICTRRWGKTVTACMKLTESALSMADRKKQPKFAYVAPQKDQAKQITWPVFKEFLWPLVDRDFAKINDQTMEVHFLNSRGKPWAQIKLYGADAGGAEAIRGNYLDGAVVDEADQTDFPVLYREIIRPSLSDTNGWLLCAGTIRGRSHLYGMFADHKDDPRWNIGVYKFEECWQDLPAYCTWDDEKKLFIPSQRKFDEVMADYKDKPQAYLREYQCDWNADGTDSLIPNDALEMAIGRHLDKSAYDFCPVVVGVDVAGEGPDSHMICVRQGNAVFPMREIKQASEMHLAEMVAAIIDMHQADMCFIDHTGGYGAGVLSRLNQLGYKNVAGVNFGNKSVNANYANKRTEMYHAIRDWLFNGGCLPKDAMLEQELGIVSCIETQGGKAMLMKKDDIRDAIGRSPDRADALALTFAAPVRGKRGYKFNDSAKTVTSTGYNPLMRRPSYGLCR